MQEMPADSLAAARIMLQIDDTLLSCHCNVARLELVKALALCQQLHAERGSSSNYSTQSSIMASVKL